MSAQYGEERVLEKFFGDRADGTLVDVGAGHPVTISNSQWLIERGWRAVLVEPLPEFAMALRAHWEGLERVQVIEAAAGNRAGMVTLWPADYVSTCCPEWRDRATAAHGKHYGDAVPVRVRTMAEILGELAVTKVDFLSVDAEGMDFEVLCGWPWAVCRPALVCLEDACEALMRGEGYELHCRTGGNWFWKLCRRGTR